VKALACMTAALLLGPLAASGQPRIRAGEVPDVGVVEQVGRSLPLDAELRDEQGRSIRLGSLFDRAVILLFVYFRCPAICRPLMQELARTLDRIEGLDPGRQYRVVVISFDPKETPEVARTTKGEIVGTMKRPVPPDAFSFLTGDQETVQRLTEAAGFHYAYDEKTDSFLHASSLIFVTREGRIVRYIGGLEFLPAQVKMAILDAMEGRERTVMQTMERLCFAYDPEGRSYVFALNRLILGATAVLVVGFAGWLIVSRRRRGSGGEQ